MDIRVLTNSSRYASPLGAGVCYLVDGGGARLLLDCAHGASGALLPRLGGEALDAVVLRHYHPEMLADLLPVALEYRPRLLFAPLAARRALANRAEFSQTTVVGVEPGQHAAVQRLRLSFGPSAHNCPGFSVRLATPGGSVGYLGDTGPVDGLADFARGVELLIAHTFLLDAEGDGAAAVNLTAGEAGRLARAAGAGHLALAHVPFYPDAAASMEEARGAFGGGVTLLREGAQIGLPR